MLLLMRGVSGGFLGILRGWDGTDEFAVVGADILRPETVESLFVAYRVTGDPIYRKWVGSSSFLLCR